MIVNFLSTISQWAIPMFILITVVYSQFKGLKVFEVFVEGAKEGFWLSVRLIPYVLGVYLAFGILRESGALMLVLSYVAPVLTWFGIPSEILPLMIVRPLSGPASLGLTVDILERHGPDSFIGRMASTIDGSTDTTLYIIALYFGSVGIRHVKYSIGVGLTADVLAMLSAVFFVKWIFG